VVAAQAAGALVVAAAGHGSAALAAASLAAVVLLLTAWVRLRRRWLFEWAAVGLHYLTRRRTFAATAPPAGLLRLVAPDAEVVPADLSGGSASMISDACGLTVVLELGDHNAVLADGAQPLPSPARLLPPGTDGPPVLLQLVLSGAPAPAPRAGGGTAATSYRQLTDGRVLGHRRAVLAVRVLRAADWSDDELRRALSSLVRKVVRRLGGVPARPLGAAALSRILAEIAHHDGGQRARETWRGLHLGGLLQCTFRLRSWPDLSTDAGRRLVSSMLALPATATTVSLSVGQSGAVPGAVTVDLTVRLAGVDASQLSLAIRGLHRSLTSAGARAGRLDGEQLPGLAATMPLAVCGGLPESSGQRPGMPAAFQRLDLPVGGAGLMIGANRHGGPVIARLFRPEATWAVLIGGVPAAQLLTLRAMALGARVVVQTTRPRVWEPFVRGVSAPGQAISLIQPGRTVNAPADALRPLLVVIDIGPVAGGGPPGPGWQATLVVRDEFTAADTDAVSRADLVLLQPLRADEAALAGSALGLGESAEWLTRIRDDMVGLVARRTVRWALLSPTAIETQLIGAPSRP
jgi:type VII secretion protein EccE